MELIQNITDAILITIITNIIIATIFFILKFVVSRIMTSKKQDNFPGIYKCTYKTWVKQDGSQKTFHEIIYIIKFNSKYYGYLLERKEGPNTLKIVKPIFRLEGKRHDEDLYIGFWLHPDKIDRRSGGFTLHIEPRGDDYNGCWSGWDRKRGMINNGTWNWRRSKKQITFFQFILMNMRITNYDNIANSTK